MLDKVNMKSQEYFFYLSSQKSTNEIVKNSILRSGKFVSPKIIQVINNYNKVTSEYKPHTLTYNTSDRILGPGRYPTPPPPRVASYKFSKSPRFADSSNVLSSSLIKSTNNSCTRLPNIPSPRPNIQKVSGNYEKVKSLKDSKNKNIENLINREAKKILETEKKDRILRSLLDKVQKAEYRKNALIKDSICKGACLVLTQLAVVHSLFFRYYKMRKRKIAARIVVGKLATISKALGKFRIVVKNLRKEKALWRIKTLIPIRLRFWLNKHKKKLKTMLSSSFDNYLTVILMQMFKDRLMNALKIIQSKILDYLVTSKARKKGLDLFWLKLNRFRILAPEHIREFYINQYIKDKLKNHYYERFREKKLDWLLNERRHQELMEEMINLKGHKKHTLRFFKKKDMNELIELANSSISSWVMIGIPAKGKKKLKSRRKLGKKTTKVSQSPSPSRDRRKNK